MKRLLLGTLVGVMAVCAVGLAQPPPPAPTAGAPKPGASAAQPDRSATEKALIANERKVMEAVAKNDKAAFLALVSADGGSADKGGFMPVKTFADAIDQVKVTKWEITDPKVMWIDANSAVVTYVWTGEGSFQGQAFAPKTYASTVWTKKGGKWMAVFHQESDAAK
jgi:hypothetical protein